VNTTTEPNPDDIIQRFEDWYEKPHPWGLYPTREGVLQVRTEAHQWVTELRAYVANPDSPYCMCAALKVAISEFRWSQSFLNSKHQPPSP
jgi:hypothetical protein